MNILIKSAKIIDVTSKHHLKRQDILIENGKISAVATKIENKNNYKEILFKNLYVSIGWFDTSVSFGEPGYEERETIANGLLVAAKSGFTAVAVNSNTQPYIDNKSAVEFLIHKAIKNATSLYPIGSLSKQSKGKELAELYDMQQSGAIAFGDYNAPISNANLMKIALQYAQNFNGLVLSFPQDETISNHAHANEGKQSTMLGLKGNPVLAEELQIARDLSLLEYTGGKLHIPTITTAKSVRLIAAAKKKGLDVSCSVSVHHLFLTDKLLETFDSNYKVSPPLRTDSDVKELLKGVKNGTIDMICSDHNPIDIEHKRTVFENAMYGTIGLESFFGALHKVLTVEEIIKAITINPRSRFHIENPTISIGEKANLTLFTPDGSYTFTEENILSTSKNSAFIGKQLQGKVYGIFSNNKLILH